MSWFGFADMAERSAAVAGMLAPVECGWCHQVYDSANVEVVSRYTDCSVWKAPCCGVIADDRQFLTHRHIIPLGPDGKPKS